MSGFVVFNGAAAGPGRPAQPVPGRGRGRSMVSEISTDPEAAINYFPEVHVVGVFWQTSANESAERPLPSRGKRSFEREHRHRTKVWLCQLFQLETVFGPGQEPTDD